MSIPERNAGGPRGGRDFSWHKRPGWTCCWAQWQDGKVVRAMWVPPAKAERPDHIPDAQQKVRPARGALSAERQAQLFPD